jgi:hypothetical protein
MSLQRRDDASIRKCRREDPARQVAQGTQGFSGLHADVLQQAVGLSRVVAQQFSRQPRVDAERYQVLLCTIVQVALESPPLGILRGNNALAGRPKFARLHRDLCKPTLERDVEPHAIQCRSRLRGQIREQPPLSRRERLEAAC